MRRVCASRMLLAVAALSGRLGAACTTVNGDRILGSDLARADAVYAALPAGFVAAYAPIPGMRRVVDAGLLTSIARAHGIEVGRVAPLCFERPTRMLDEAWLRPVLEQALDEGTRIEIVDFSRNPVPYGELTFSIAELARPGAAAADAPVTWRGNVRYGGQRTVAIWAKVRIAKEEHWVEAISAIPARTAISADQVAVRAGWRFPFSSAPARGLDEVIGRQLARSLNAGQPVLPALLMAPNDVNRGEMVDAEVASGGVSLRFSARAETGGHRSQLILVTATDTGRRFRASVQDKGKVLIHAENQNDPNRAVERAAGGRSAPARSGRGTEEVNAERTGIASGQVPR